MENICFRVQTVCQIYKIQGSEGSSLFSYIFHTTDNVLCHRPLSINTVQSIDLYTYLHTMYVIYITNMHTFPGGVLKEGKYIFVTSAPMPFVTSASDGILGESISKRLRTRRSGNVWFVMAVISLNTELYTGPSTNTTRTRNPKPVPTIRHQ